MDASRALPARQGVLDIQRSHLDEPGYEADKSATERKKYNDKESVEEERNTEGEAGRGARNHLVRHLSV